MTKSKRREKILHSARGSSPSFPDPVPPQQIPRTPLPPFFLSFLPQLGNNPPYLLPSRFVLCRELTQVTSPSSEPAAQHSSREGRYMSPPVARLLVNPWPPVKPYTIFLLVGLSHLSRADGNPR